MSTTTAALIEDSRDGIRTYTDGFAGDIGKRFKRVDARLERALDAIEDEAEAEEVRDILHEAQSDLRRVVNACFTGVSPGNMSEYVEEPVERAIESIE
jgi:hypothetical protein